MLDSENAFECFKERMYLSTLVFSKTAADGGNKEWRITGRSD